MSDRLRLWVISDVLPLVPNGSPYHTVAYWMQRCEEIGLDFDKPGPKNRLIALIRAEAGENNGRPVPIGQVGDTPGVF